MASLVNPYFQGKTTTVEPDLFNRIKKEAIKVMGRTYFYLPRKMQVANLILGEDVISSFDVSVPIEMYMEQSTGFEGDKEMFSKFGLQVQNSYTLVVAKDRWEAEVRDQYVLDNEYRPSEGDLIWDPLTRFLMEIKFVDHDADFYQVGHNYLYHLSCEAFQYGSETIDTGNADIDAFTQKTQDLLEYQLLTEDGYVLTFEDDSSFLQDGITHSAVIAPKVGTDFPAPTPTTLVINDPFA